MCDACKDRGWLLVNNTDHGIRIERCDSCGQFQSDEQAVQAVAELAEWAADYK